MGDSQAVDLMPILYRSIEDARPLLDAMRSFAWAEVERVPVDDA
jgi:hypothetical protein